MAGGDQLTAFLDFEKAQAEHRLNIPSGFIADGSPKHKFLWPRLFRGEAAEVDKVQAGDSIKYFTVLSQTQTGEAYKPGGTATPSNLQNLEEGTAYWRFYRWNKTYNKKEISFNGDGPQTKMWLDIWTKKQAALNSSINDFMEDELWAVPYKSLMEGSGSEAIRMYSLFAHINEDASGLFGENWTGETWTVKQTLDPTTARFGNNMKPQTRTYSNFTPGSSASLISAFHNMSKDVTWEMPMMLNQYWESDVMNKQMIIASRAGHTVYQNMIQSTNGGQDLFLGGKQDPSVPDPQYYGIPITWNDTYGAAAVYDNGSNGLADETTADITGPRFMWVNGNYIRPVVKSDMFFTQDSELRGVERPDTFVIYTDLACNLICTSYKRQGVVSPSTDL